MLSFLIKNMDQIIFIYKPTGITSYDVIRLLKKKLNIKKIGHAGTLDPFATGLLIIGIGKDTKKLTEFVKLDKEYEATLKLGFVSTTDDPEGEIKSVSLKKPTLKQIINVVNEFIGKIEQIPSKYSAIKINGKPAYKRIRNNEDFNIPKRQVEVYSIDMLSYNYPYLKLKCNVSSGTYIRTLAKDIGEKLGTGAYLTELKRTKVGDILLEQAIKLEDIKKETKL